MGSRVLFALAIAALLAGAPRAGAAPAAAPLKLHTTDGWKAQLPSDWSLARHQRYGLAKHIGRWRFESPNGNWKLSIRVAPDSGADYRKAAEENIGRLRKKLGALDQMARARGTPRPTTHD